MLSRVSGRRIIVLIFALGLMAAGSALYFQYETGRRAAKFWGPEAASLIAQAPMADLLRLAPLGEASDNPEEILRLGDRRWAVLARRDLASARGFSNVRHGLTRDGAFAPDATEDDPEWTQAIRFRAGDRAATVLFTRDAREVGLAETGAKVSLDAEFARVLGEFFDDVSGR